MSNTIAIAIRTVWSFPRRALGSLSRGAALMYIVLGSLRRPPAPLTAILRLAFVMHRGKEAPVFSVSDLDENGLAEVTLQIEVSCFDEEDIKIIAKINEEESGRPD